MRHLFLFAKKPIDIFCGLSIIEVSKANCFRGAVKSYAQISLQGAVKSYAQISLQILAE